MDNIGRLASAVSEIYKAAEAARNPTDVGAVKGVLSDSNTVTISGKGYYAIFVSPMHPVPGERVWCQIAGSGRAVVIGGA